MPANTWDEEWIDNDTLVVRAPAVPQPYYFDPNPHLGRVAYTHGPGLDQPLAITRVDYVDTLWNKPAYVHYPTFSVIPYWDWKGSASHGRMDNGQPKYCVRQDGSGACAEVPWSIKSFTFTQTSSARVSSWFGTLIASKEDLTGTLYRRNRNLDPATGRFTQEDPIGLAGGVNVYGFANGDPVTYSDPFGLCPRVNGLARGLGSLQCAIEQVIGAIRAAPGMFARAMTEESDNIGFAVSLATIPFTVVGSEGKLLFHGSRAALREAMRTGAVELSGGQVLALGHRLGKGRVDDVAIAAGGNGTIRAIISRQVDKLTEVTTRVYDRAGKQIDVWIRRFNSAGDEVY
jgi:RHS repeat-associated protein